MKKIVSVALNTMNYLGHGSAYDQDGLDVYQLAGWMSKASLARLNFIRSAGDANQTKLQIFDRHPLDPAAELMYEDVFGTWTYKNLDLPPRPVFLDRLHVKLVALDGVLQNHCQLVVHGEYEQ